MNDKTYNGWTNYATWRVNLEMVDGVDPREHFTSSTDVDELASEIEGYVKGYIDEFASGMALDYALAFLDDVNWHEIAEHMAEAYELFQTEVEA
jgi:hypothetical protein